MSERAAREPDGPAGIPGWELLSPTARQALVDLARVFSDRVGAEVKIVAAEGSARGFHVTLSGSGYRKLSERTA